MSQSAPRTGDVCLPFLVLDLDFRVKGAKSNSRTRQTVANIAGPGRRMGQDRRPGEQQQNKKKSNVEPKPTPGGWGKQNKTKQNETKQNMTKQNENKNKTKHNKTKTKQNKTKTKTNENKNKTKHETDITDITRQAGFVEGGWWSGRAPKQI